MENKKGFTLVELLVVIVIIGLLIAIAIPSGLAISKKIKQKMLDTKIEQIESAATIWGQSNKTELTTKSEDLCPSVYDDEKVDKCISKSISELLALNALEEDEIDDSGNKVLINPVSNKPLNDCTIEIYQKNKRIYAKYDINGTNCYNNETNIPDEITHKILVNGSDEGGYWTFSLDDLIRYATNTSYSNIKTISAINYEQTLNKIRSGNYAAIECPETFISGGNISAKKCFFENNTISLAELDNTVIQDLTIDQFTFDTKAFMEDEDPYIDVTIKLKMSDKNAEPFTFRLGLEDNKAPYLAYKQNNFYYVITGNATIESKELYDSEDFYQLDNFDILVEASDYFYDNSYEQWNGAVVNTKYFEGSIFDKRFNDRYYGAVVFQYTEATDDREETTCNACSNCFFNKNTHGGTLSKEADIKNGSNYTCDGCNIGSVSIISHECTDNGNYLMCTNYYAGECSCKIKVELYADCENGQTVELEIENYGYNY